MPYIVMAFVQGTSWKEMYDKNGGPLPESEALRLLLGIRGAFEYLHHRTPPVVYRDFKPGNVIQVDEGNGTTRQVLIDLGTAMEYFPGQKREAWGTVGFAPPEIGGICEQPPTMDLFAIVSTLAALLGVDVERSAIGAPPRRRVARLAGDLRLRRARARPRPSRALPDGRRAVRPAGGHRSASSRARSGRGLRAAAPVCTVGTTRHAGRRAGARAEHDLLPAGSLGLVGHDRQDQRTAGAERGGPCGASCCRRRAT